MDKDVIPRGLQDAHMAMDLNVLGKQFIRKYAGQLGAENGSKMLDIGAFADTAHIDIEGNSKYWYGMDYYVMNLEGDPHPKFIQADITSCPQVPDASFDFIYTQDTFEHIAKPWLAAQEMIRLLKPKGLIYVITLFSWRYHRAPEDYFRYTPFGLMSLFEGLNHCEANWDGKNRRGLDGIGLQGDGTANDLVPVDMLGAFRENWRVLYLGQKPWNKEHEKRTGEIRGI